LKYVRRHVKPCVDLIKEWFQHLKPKIKRTKKAITHHPLPHCCKTAFISRIWKPIAMTSCRVRGHLIAWLTPELSKEKKEEQKRQEQVQMATEKLRRHHLQRAGNSRRNYSTMWRGLRYSILLDLLFLLSGVNGKHHPDMATILEHDPQFEWSRETLLAYASEVHDLPKPAQSNNSLSPGRLCTFNRNETFSQMAATVLDSGGFLLHDPSRERFCSRFTSPFQ
jgi:hypothetical protein